MPLQQKNKRKSRNINKNIELRLRTQWWKLCKLNGRFLQRHGCYFFHICDLVSNYPGRRGLLFRIFFKISSACPGQDLKPRPCIAVRHLPNSPSSIISVVQITSVFVFKLLKQPPYCSGVGGIIELRTSADYFPAMSRSPKSKWHNGQSRLLSQTFISAECVR